MNIAYATDIILTKLMMMFCYRTLSVNSCKSIAKKNNLQYTALFLSQDLAQNCTCPSGYKYKSFGSWSSGNAFVAGVGGLSFKSRVVQLRLSVANGLLPL